LPDTRYLKDLRLQIEIDQGYPLTAAQDVTLKHMLANGKTTIQQAAERLIALRPKPKA
jgi:hypothetical protein